MNWSPLEQNSDSFNKLMDIPKGMCVGIKDTKKAGGIVILRQAIIIFHQNNRKFAKPILKSYVR